MTAVDFTFFLLDNCQHCQRWGWKKVFGLVRHAMKWGCVAWSEDSRGKCDGVAIGRPIRNKEQAEHWYRRDETENGIVLWIDVAVAITRKAIRNLWKWVAARFPRQEVIGFKRIKKGKERIVFKKINVMNRYLKI